jgi:hypothetical protein
VNPIVITKDNANEYFRIERLTAGVPLDALVIYEASSIAIDIINPYCAARFITVDADVEHDSNVLAFYEKTGFVPNAELSGRNRKTISMRLDLYS